jgi:hypothetical protein
MRARQVRWIVAACAAAVVSSALQVPATATTVPEGDVIRVWDEVGVEAFTAARLSPAEGYVILALSSIATYDTVMATHRQYEPFVVDASAPAGASVEAAVAGAAHRVLAHHLPDQVGTILDPALAASLEDIPDGPAEEAGLRLGRQVADALIADRVGDGFRAPTPPYVPSDPPVAGRWIPTATTPPVGRYLPAMRTFAIPAADTFRPAGPPALGSKRWARDYEEAVRLGSDDSTRSDEQTVQAKFWAEPPVQQSRASIRRFATDHDLNLVQAARWLAMASVIQVDSFIACFDAKYAYEFWRPITAVRAGDTDGNPATVGDPTWTPLLPATPNHPEYPSAHSCITPALGIAATRFLGTAQIDFTVPSLTGLGDRTFATTSALRRDVQDGRVLGGIHFRSAVVDGATIARSAAHYILARHFKPVD